MPTLTSKIIPLRGRQALTNFFIEVWAIDRPHHHLLGSSLPDQAGNFTISYADIEEGSGRGRVGLQVYVKIYQDDQLIISTQDKPTSILRGTIPDITITSTDDDSVTTNTVKGIIATPKGRGIANCLVRAYAKTIHDEGFLSEAITNNKGEYVLYYSAAGGIRSRIKTIDLQVKVFADRNQRAPLITSPLFINSLPHEEINLSVGEGDYQGMDTYTQLHEIIGDQVTAYLKDLAERDVLIMANEHGLPVDEVAYYVLTRQWAAAWQGLPAEVYFGWLKSGLPQRWVPLVNTPVEKLKTALAQAVVQNIVPDHVGRLAQGLDKILAKWRTESLITRKGERIERGSIGELLSAAKLTIDQRKQLLDDWQSFDGGIEEFWKLQQNRLGDENYRDLELTLQLGTVTRNHLPLVQAIKNKSSVRRIPDLAAISEADWRKLLEEEALQVPEDIQGEDLSAKRAAFAALLRHITEELVPTAVLAHAFEEDSEIDSSTLKRFLVRNPEFEFRAKTVNEFLKENPDALADASDQAAAKRELEAVQRIFHLTPSKDKHKSAKALWKNGLHSAYSIKMGGAAALQTLFEGDEALAERVYSNAAMRHSQAKMVKMQLHAAITPIYAVSAGMQGILKGWDKDADLEALFGDQGYCTCKHCDSFFSPSAYLADLFLFLNKVKIAPGQTNSTSDTALERLFQRRPDLGNIELNCANSHTPLPYIDLVNEVMEMAIVPFMYQSKTVNIYGKNVTLPKAAVPQTEKNALTLKAYPQHLRTPAYDQLIKGANNQTIAFPWSLPFNLWMLEVRTYLNHLGVSRAELMNSILGGAVNSEQKAAEYLNLLPEELPIFNEQAANPGTTLRYWGTSASQLNQVPVFLKQTGYRFEQFTRLLRMRYLRYGGEVVFNPPASCLVSDASISNLSDQLLSSMHKFGRLLLKTKEDMYVLDRTIMAFGGEINSAFLQHYAHVLQLEQLLRAKIDRQELLSWWSPIDGEDYSGKSPSLYAKLFMNPKEIEEFTLNTTKDELKNPGAVIDPLAMPLEPDLLAPLLSATKLKAQDLVRLVAEALPGQVITLNLSQISYLYRIASFCRTLRITIADYLALTKILGYQPLSTMLEKATPGHSLAFIRQYQTIKEVGFDIEILDYILRHQVRPNAPFAFQDEEIEKVLKQLQAILQFQFREVFPAGTTPREIVATKLKILIGTEGEAALEKVKAVESIIDGSSELPEQEQAGFIDQEMVFFLDKQDAKNQLLTNDSITEAQRFQYALQAIDRYLLENAIIQQLSESMALQQHMTAALLEGLLVHPSDATVRAIDVFLDEAFIYADPAVQWTQAAFADAYYVLIKLHKIKLLITALDLSLPDVAFIMAPASAAAGMPDFNALPVQAAATVSGVENWLSLFKLVLLNKEVFKIEHSVFSLLRLSHDSSTSQVLLLQRVSESTGWKINDLLYLTGPEGMNLSFPQDYRNGDWLGKLANTLALVARVGATAKQMAGWAAPNITKAQADAVRHAAMAKYGEDQWQEITIPLRHNIREAQRDALVQYVLHYGKKHTGSKFQDIDDLYAYYLIDTQMSACTDTSRIVLATSSVQLFVQRVMMNLEPGLSLPTSFAKEWKWRKYYRVWEANRKVFMWPENWIEPELRDDKTPLFKELENEMMQGELTSENVETAYVNYLEKLHEISHLKVVGMYEDGNAFHVIAHTPGIPEKYYYRRLEGRSHWTAWEKIELDIFNGEQIDQSERGILITPVVHNRKLFLFWPLFKLKKEPPTLEDEGEIESKKQEIDGLDSKNRWCEREINKLSRKIDLIKQQAARLSKIDPVLNFVDFTDYLEQLDASVVNLEDKIEEHANHITTRKSRIRVLEEEIRDMEKGYMCYTISMAWSQYQNGFWTPKKVSSEAIVTQRFIEEFINGAAIKNYVIQPIRLNSGNLEFWIHYTQHKMVYQYLAHFLFDDCRSEIITVSSFFNPRKANRMNDLKKSMSFMKINVQTSPLQIVNNSNTEVLLLEKTYTSSKMIQSFQSNAQPDLYKTVHPFFYEDAKHCFFVKPPSASVNMAMSPAYAATSSLRSGTNVLQDASYITLSSATAPLENNPARAQFTANRTATTSFYQQNHAQQVIVRDKNNMKVSAQNGWAFGEVSIAESAMSGGIASKINIELNGYQFYPFYHPYTCMFLKQLNRYGIDGLLNPNHNSAEGKELVHQATGSQINPADLRNRYKPNLSEVVWLSAKEEIDFTHGNAYATYNWELFYHIPLFIATRLSQDQRFDEAQNWFHYIFNPTETQGEVPYRFWKIKPFHTYTADQIKKDIEAVLKGGETIKQQIKAWEENPFNPHMLARFRRLAYMKNVVMKYLDNLIAWGDQLFRMDSIESMNEATQLYVLAGQILGKLPVETEAKPRKSKSFNELAEQLTAMGNAWVEIENHMSNEYELADNESKYSSIAEYTIAKDKTLYQKNSIAKKVVGSGLVSGASMKRPGKIKAVGNGATTSILDDILYFCMSPNEKLLSYWDTVADRLFKIRHCLNIEGLVRNVPLFQPPIDPALLVKAAAAGVDISSAISDLYAPMPYYRFHVLIQKAQEVCQELKSLGSTLLSTLEKRDAEQIALIRSRHEIQLLEANKEIRKQQIEEAHLAVLALEESRKLAQIRYNHYSDKDFMNAAEAIAMVLATGTSAMQIAAVAAASGAAMAAQSPDIVITGHSQGISSGISQSTYPPASGSKNVQTGMGISRVFDILAIISRDAANNMSTVAAYERRMEEWSLQVDLANQEMKQLDKQILASLIREEISAKEKENLDLQIEHSKQLEAYMRNRYTNQELYNWFIGQIAAVYFQTYKMAYDISKQAEKAFRFELGIESSNYIKFGYWDNMRKGLLAGEKLSHDLKKLEITYLEKNKRNYEITKHVSLALLDPFALVRLRATGQCEFEIPEVLYDMDHPGQYFRRIKSVSISMPCVAGPYTSVGARLSLIKSRYRKSTNAGSGYSENLGSEGLGNDERFAYNLSAVQSIATSHAQNDSGMFELNFRDERYLPFEGMGAISHWKLELPTKARQWDYDTIADVIVHINYTAREGGSILKIATNEVLQEQLASIRQNFSKEGTYFAEGLHFAINIKHDMPNEWHRLKHHGATPLLIDKSRLPYMAQPFEITIKSILFLAKGEDVPVLMVDGVEVDFVTDTNLSLQKGMSSDIVFATPFSLSISEADKIHLQELIFLINYIYV